MEPFSLATFNSFHPCWLHTWLRSSVCVRACVVFTAKPGAAPLIVSGWSSAFDSKNALVRILPLGLLASATPTPPDDDACLRNDD
jgi:hypothetical protein